MGLQEKQTFAEVNEKYLPVKLEELKTVTGAQIEVSFDVASFTTVNGIKAIPDSIFTRLNSDMADICKDKLGKEAVGEAIKKINIVNHATGGFVLDLNAGTFTVTAKLDGSLGKDIPSYGDYKKFLMAKL